MSSGMNFYYPETIRNVTTAFMNIFNGMVVQRYDKSGVLVKTIPVPITFAPTEKFQQINLVRESGKWRTALGVPRLAVSLNSITYNESRAIGVNEVRAFYDKTQYFRDLDSFFTDVQPTPYDFTFSLFIRTDLLNDFSQIMENILPYFNPSIYLRVKEFSFLNIERDIQVTMGSISPQFIDDQNETQTRFINADISFTLQGFMYRPISSAKIIKYIKTNYITQGVDATGAEMGAIPVSDYTIFQNLSGVNEITGTSHQPI